jgi:hypothetical protein
MGSPGCDSNFEKFRGKYNRLRMPPTELHSFLTEKKEKKTTDYINR